MIKDKYLVIYILLILLPLMVLLLVYPKLPEMIVVRNAGTLPSDFENKSTLFILPIINIFIGIMAIFTPILEKNKFTNLSINVTKKVFLFVLIIFNIVIYTEILMAMNIITINTFLFMLFILLMPLFVIFIITKYI